MIGKKSTFLIFHSVLCKNRTYNPEDGRGKKKPVSREKAMNELLEVVSVTISYIVIVIM